MHADKVLVKICLTLLTDTNPDFMKKGISYRCAQNVNAEFLGGIYSFWLCSLSHNFGVGFHHGSEVQRGEKSNGTSYWL